MSGLPERLRPLAKLVIKAFGLSHWEIKFGLFPELDDGFVGMTDLRTDYYRAKIRITPEDGGKEQASTLLHELMHVGLYEIDQAAQDIILMLPEDDRDRAQTIYRRGEEQYIERVGRSLMPVLLRALPPGSGK